MKRFEFQFGEVKVSAELPDAMVEACREHGRFAPPIDIEVAVHPETEEQHAAVVEAAGGLAAFPAIDPTRSWMSLSEEADGEDAKAVNGELTVWKPEKVPSEAKQPPGDPWMHALRDRQAKQIEAA